MYPKTSPKLSQNSRKAVPRVRKGRREPQVGTRMARARALVTRRPVPHAELMKRSELLLLLLLLLWTVFLIYVISTGLAVSHLFREKLNGGSTVPLGSVILRGRVPVEERFVRTRLPAAARRNRAAEWPPRRAPRRATCRTRRSRSTRRPCSAQAASMTRTPTPRPCPLR